MNLAIFRNIMLLVIVISMIVACALDLSEQPSASLSVSARLLAEGRANLSGAEQAIGVAQLKRAAELGESAAYGELAFFYFFEASPQDIEQGVRYAQDGVAMHNSKSFFVLGFAYCMRRVSGKTRSQGLALISRGLNEDSGDEGLLCGVGNTCAALIDYEKENGVGSSKNISVADLLVTYAHGTSFHHPKCNRS